MKFAPGEGCVGGEATARGEMEEKCNEEDDKATFNLLWLRSRERLVRFPIKRC